MILIRCYYLVSLILRPFKANFYIKYDLKIFVESSFIFRKIEDVPFFLKYSKLHLKLRIKTLLVYAKKSPSFSLTANNNLKQDAINYYLV